MSSRLEDRGRHDTEGCRQETQTDISQCRNTDIIHLLAVLRVEDSHQLPREQLECHKTDRHDNTGDHKSFLISLHQSFPVSGAVIETHDRQNSLVQTEDRHEDKGLQSAVYTHNGNSCFRQCSQNDVHTKLHDRCDGLH